MRRIVTRNVGDVISISVTGFPCFWLGRERGPNYMRRAFAERRVRGGAHNSPLTFILSSQIFSVMTKITDNRKFLPIAIERFVLHWGEMAGNGA